MGSFEKALPVEQWHQILIRVPPRDLCNVTLSSTYMNSVASLPDLWVGMKVNLRKVLVNGLVELFNISRFQKIKQIDFSGVYLTSEQLEKLMDDIPGFHLEDINLTGRNLSGVSADKLARAVSHLHKINLESTRLSTAQCTQLLDTIPSSATLAYVNLASVNLSGVPADVLATAVCHLKTVNLSRTELTTNQLVKVLDTIPSSATLTNLDLQRNNLSGVSAYLLATAVCHLKTVNLSNTRLTVNQWAKVLDTIPSSVTLANLDLEGINLSGVPAHLLATAVCHLENVHLSRTKLTTDQWVKLLDTIPTSATLIKLDLHWINLSRVPAELLATAVCHLETVNLSSTQLTTNQCVKLLETSLSSTSLTNLDLYRINLSAVPADLLAAAVCRLKTVNLSSTKMTNDQCVNVLETRLSFTRLTNLTMDEFNLGGVPDHLRAKTVGYPGSFSGERCQSTLEYGAAEWVG